MIAFPEALEEFLNTYNAMYEVISDEVMKLCINLLQQKLMQDKEDSQPTLIADFLFNCMIQKRVKVDDYLTCIEIVLNSTAFLINNTKIECFTTICLNKAAKIPMKLKKRITDVNNLLFFFKDKQIEKVRRIFT